MKLHHRLICTIGLALAVLAPSALAQTKVIYLTRHAEKVSTGTDPALTPEGQVRAQNIASILKKAGVKHIYATSYLRTQQTAAPLASYLSLTVQQYDPTQLAAFANTLKALPDNALVVGHSDTTPDLVTALGGVAGTPIAETEFDRLYQLVIDANGTVVTNMLTSVPSPITAPCNTITLNKTNVAVATGAWIYYTIDVPECANTLTVNMSGGTGDGDLFVRFGAQPTASAYDCRPFKTGNSESCPLSNPAAGTWYIGINAYKAFSGVTVTASAAP